MRAHAYVVALTLAATAHVAAADPFVHETLTIPMAAAGASGLEALLMRPSAPGRYPLALINHGSPRDGAARRSMSPRAMLPHATEFARRGWAAVVLMRRGFGGSGGGFADDFGTCRDPDYLKAAANSTADIKAAVAFLAQHSNVDTARFISVGVSAGGFATIALTADPPSGLAAGINFAGGRGSLEDDQVCKADRLIDAYRSFGRRSRKPTLWVYAENDRFFGPALARQFKDAFVAGGGSADLVMAPPFGRDGHLLFSAGGIPRWTPIVDDFLKRNKLALRDALIAAPQRPATAAPAQLSERGRREFAAFLASGTHKAFAVSPDGHFGWRSGRRTVDEAKADALENCRRSGKNCRLVVVDDSPVP